jgi:uncharacterized protein YndB with AHSA1/START domain
MDNTRMITVTRFIAAPPAKIFDLLASPREHVRLDGSGSVVGVKKGPERLFLGAKFSMAMKMGARYSTTNKVVAFEENRAIAWHHLAQFVWRYDLKEENGGTSVTESFNYDKPWAFAIIRTGFLERNRAAMEATLARIDSIVSA